MAVVVDATIGGVSANSYVTKAEFDTYLATRLHNSTAVTGATTDTINRAIVTAARLLDNNFAWDEDSWPTYYETQRLQCPRIGLYDALGDEIDNDVIPEAWKNANCEFAVYLIDKDPTAELSEEGLESLSVGSISLGFSSIAPKKRKVIPDAVFEMIQIWGTRRGDSHVIKLTRA